MRWLVMRRPKRGWLCLISMISSPRPQRCCSPRRRSNGFSTSSTAGLDHILVDEAQDTSPVQWQVIRSLAAEFFSGEGARDEARTLFAVGDEKQSIYGFQGAAPTMFAAAGNSFAAAARQAERAAGGRSHCTLIVPIGRTPAAARSTRSSPRRHARRASARPTSRSRTSPTASVTPACIEIWPLAKGRPPQTTRPPGRPLPRPAPDASGDAAGGAHRRHDQDAGWKPASASTPRIGRCAPATS